MGDFVNTTSETAGNDIVSCVERFANIYLFQGIYTVLILLCNEFKIIMFFFHDNMLLNIKSLNYGINQPKLPGC